ncbi:MAG: hypothetical protein JO352_04330 [Chloroflexi bacterium]|nr:hypothetical protein [Chloroflexota bacterium]
MRTIHARFALEKLSATREVVDAAGINFRNPKELFVIAGVNRRYSRKPE